MNAEITEPPSNPTTSSALPGGYEDRPQGKILKPTNEDMTLAVTCH
jgi:hypothetical protein